MYYLFTRLSIIFLTLLHSLYRKKRRRIIEFIHSAVDSLTDAQIQLHPLETGLFQLLHIPGRPHAAADFQLILNPVAFSAQAVRYCLVCVIVRKLFVALRKIFSAIVSVKI